MKRNTFIISIAIALLLSACGTAAPATAQDPEPAPVSESNPVPKAESESDSEATEQPVTEKITVVDDLGYTLEFEGYPQSIVSISPSTTEVLFAIGAGNQVVGRDDFSLYPEEALAIPSVGALWEELPTEAILALEPDLVVAAQIISEDQVLALRELGLNVYW